MVLLKMDNIVPFSEWHQQHVYLCKEPLITRELLSVYIYSWIVRWKFVSTVKLFEKQNSCNITDGRYYNSKQDKMTKKQK